MKSKQLLILVAGAAAVAAAVLAGVYYTTLDAQRSAPAYTKPAKMLEKFDMPEPVFTDAPRADVQPPDGPDE